MSIKLISTKNFGSALLCFRALSDPIRLNVINLLKDREMCVCDICEVLGIKQPKLSFHLKALRECGLLNTRQEGRWVYYSLNPDRFEIVVEYLNQYISSEVNSSESCAK